LVNATSSDQGFRLLAFIVGAYARWHRKSFSSHRRKRMLWTIVAILLILWLLGFSFSVGGGLIHALLVIALIVVVVRLLTGRKVV